ncbi:MAG: hypothetical protein M3P11_11165 [Actinomycetota bacterium]|nr:hypothetical protein [Actinomycetota bacterium]
MSDDQPIDLQALDPHDTEDHARAAIRRFRWRVVLLTTVVIVAVAAGAIWGTSAYVRQRDRQRDEISVLREWAAGPESQVAIAGGSNCSTPTYKVGYADVTVLQGLKYQGGWLLHLFVQGTGHPLAIGGKPGSHEVSHTMTIVPMVQGATAAKVRIQDTGWTSGEAYVQVPGSSSKVGLQLLDPTGSTVGMFVVDTSRLLCG